MNSLDAPTNIQQYSIERLVGERSYIEKKWQSLLVLIGINGLVSLWAHLVVSASTNIDVSQVLIDQLLELLLNFTVVYILIGRFAIKKVTIKPAIICIALYILGYILNITELYGNDSSQIAKASTSLKLLIVSYDQFIGPIIEIFFILSIVSAILRARHEQDGLWAQKETLLKSYSEAQLEAYGLFGPVIHRESFFSECFRRHTLDEAEQLLMVGTSSTTPKFNSDMAVMPKPWLFSWVLLRCLVVYLILVLCWYTFKNEKMLPGIMVVGSFAVPFSFLIFFYEINTPRNISFIKMIHITLIGGVLAILVSLLFFEVLPVVAPPIYMLGASSAGIVEEIGKLLGLLIIMNAMPNISFRYRLNALLVGAAVGAGFSAFESAGYALDTLFAYQKPDEMVNAMSGNMIIRAILSPFTHIVWTAIAASAYWQARKAHRTIFEAITSTDFLKLFGFVMFLHMMWNWSWGVFDILKFCVLGYLAYWQTSKLIRQSFGELKEISQ